MPTDLSNVSPIHLRPDKHCLGHYWPVVPKHRNSILNLKVVFVYACMYVCVYSVQVLIINSSVDWLQWHHTFRMPPLVNLSLPIVYKPHLCVQVCMCPYGMFVFNLCFPIFFIYFIFFPFLSSYTINAQHWPLSYSNWPVLSTHTYLLERHCAHLHSYKCVIKCAALGSEMTAIWFNKSEKINDNNKMFINEKKENK